MTATDQIPVAEDRVSGAARVDEMCFAVHKEREVFREEPRGAQVCRCLLGAPLLRHALPASFKCDDKVLGAALALVQVEAAW